MKRLQKLGYLFYDYVWKPLFVGSDDGGLVFARLVWFGWFGFLCLYTLYTHAYSEPLSDINFAQCTGIVSAVAILCTLLSRSHPWRLHWLMLALCCFNFMALQRPAGDTPHGRFLRSFTRIEDGMTADTVASLMQDATVEGIPVRSAAAHRKWFHNGYSGWLIFSHEGPRVDGYYSVDFYKGRVISAYCNND